MKSIIILGDGMADEPIEALGGKTPMQYADTPYMDKLAEMGVTGRMKTVADGFHPGSEVANMAVLGYDLPTVYEGRGVLEAASIGYDLKPGEMAMRCNLICVEGDILKNHSSGHITTEEADELLEVVLARKTPAGGKGKRRLGLVLLKIVGRPSLKLCDVDAATSQLALDLDAPPSDRGLGAGEQLRKPPIIKKADLDEPRNDLVSHGGVVPGLPELGRKLAR